MKKYRFALAIVIVGVLLFTSAAIVSAGQKKAKAKRIGQEKITVCHITGTYDFGDGDVSIGHLITIAKPALPAHLRHGDAEEWGIGELENGDVVCTAQAEEIGCPCFTAQELADFVDYLEGLEDGGGLYCTDDTQICGVYGGWVFSTNDGDYEYAMVDDTGGYFTCEFPEFSYTVNLSIDEYHSCANLMEEELRASGCCPRGCDEDECTWTE